MQILLRNNSKFKTTNVILLAAEGFRFARLLRTGEYLGCPSRKGATHYVRSTRPFPRYEKHPPRGVIRCIYDDPKNFVDFPKNDEGRQQADEWIKSRRELANGAAPSSAVTIPFGKRYNNFVQRRTEAASDGSLYDKQNKSAMSKKPAAPAAKKVTKNDITRPKPGTTTGKVWDLADRLKERASVLAAAAKAKINPATAMTQFGKWRAFNGLVGKRTAKAKAKPTPPKRKPTPPKKAKAKPAPAAPVTVDASSS